LLVDQRFLTLLDHSIQQIMKIGNIMLSPLALLYLPAAILRDASASAAASSRPKVLGRLYGRLELPDGRPLNYTAKIVLNHGEIVAYSRSDGSFAVERVPPGIHVLDVHDPVYHFSQFKIQLLADDVDNPSILEYYYPGATKQPRSLPIVWTPLATYDYFEHRSGFSLFGLLRSPMLLFMLFSAGMMASSPAVEKSSALFDLRRPPSLEAHARFVSHALPLL
jgi:hypothetical protein